MNLDEYQKQALKTSRPKDAQDEIFHLLLALCGESGEIAEKAKKIIRDKGSDFSQWDRDDIVKELGDVLWYVAVIANYFDISLGEVGDKNIAKLADRMKRNILLLYLNKDSRANFTLFFQMKSSAGFNDESIAQKTF